MAANSEADRRITCWWCSAEPVEVFELRSWDGALRLVPSRLRGRLREDRRWVQWRVTHE